MNKIHPFFAAMVVLFLASVAGAQTATEQQTASISGRVTLTGQPARGIKVSLVPGPYGSPETPGRQSARTDDNGRYELKGLAAGRYGILAASYIYASDDLFTSQIKPFKVCTLTAGEKLEGLDIRLVRGGVITGRVTDASDRPVIVERVQLTFVDSTGKQQTFPAMLNDEMWLTDDRGVYRFYGLPPGRYLLSVGKEVGQSGPTSDTARGFYRRVYYPGVNEIEGAELIEVKEGSEITGIDVRLGAAEKTFVVSGRVIDAANSQPVPGSHIDFDVFDKQTNRLRSWSLGLPVNERAEFYFSGLPPGRYAIGAMPDATRNYYSETIEFEIKDEDIEGMDVKLQRGASIGGVVVIEGVADPVAALRSTKVRIRPRRLDPGQSSDRQPWAGAQPDGTFEIKALPPGKFRLEILSESQGLHLLRIERGGEEMRGAFDLKPGEQVRGVRVVLAQATGVLRGRVNLLGALPDGWALDVTVRWADGGEQHERAVQLDSSNGFLVQNLPSGDYEIVVTLTNRNSGDNRPPVEPLRRRASVRDGTTTEVTLTIDLPK